MAKPLHEYDFHSTGMRVSAEDRDWDADLYLSEHFTELIALDYLRVVNISMLAKGDLLEVRDDGYAYPTEGDSGKNTAAMIMGWRSASSRLTTTGRLDRSAIKTLADEMKATGRIRVKMLPDFPGFQGSADDADDAEDP